MLVVLTIRQVFCRRNGFETFLGYVIMIFSGKHWGLVAVLFAGVFSSGTVVFAQAPVEPTEAEKSADLVEELATAAQLTAFGRGELADATGLKDFKSPEALVAAGAIYLRAHKATGGKVKASDAKIEDSDGKAVAEEGAAPSFADDAEALFDEARALATKNSAAVEALIKQAKTVESRGATGGPRVINRTVKSGKNHTIHIQFDANSPASVNMRGTGTTQFEVLGPAGKVLWHSKGSWGFYNWHTGRGGVKDITVKVINRGGPPVAYTVTTN